MSTYRHPPIDSTVVIKDAHITEGGKVKIRMHDATLQALLDDVLVEMKIANLHNALTDDINITESDLP